MLVRVHAAPANASFAQAAAVPVAGQTALPAGKGGEITAGQFVVLV